MTIHDALAVVAEKGEDWIQTLFFSPWINEPPPSKGINKWNALLRMEHDDHISAFDCNHFTFIKYIAIIA